MSEMVERIAKALAEHSGDNWETCLKAPGLRRAGMYRTMARAAIEAMREPTEKMSEAGCPFPDNGGAPYCYDRDLINGAYKAMIDAVLTD